MALRKIDDTDWRILDILQDDARIPVSKLAAATGLARTFDADVLAKQMLGSAADREEAQRWYARARELGERDAGTVALH